MSQLTPTIDDREAKGSSVEFAHQLVVTSVEESVAVLRICRKQARQTLNPAVIFQLHDAITRAEANPEIQGIVLTGSGSAFVNGIDIGYFLTAIERGESDRLIEFSRAGNECFDVISRCSKPIVAALNGSALGGGLELAMACHQRVVTMAASLALPETGLGLVPGWGGSYRASQLLGQGLARWLVYCGTILSARDALAIGLVDAVTTPGDLLETSKRLALEPASGERAIQAVTPRQGIAQFFTRNSLDDILGGKCSGMRPGELSNIEQTLATKGPLALRLVERQLSLVEQLASEALRRADLEIIAQVVRSHDAYLGLKSLQKGKKGPVSFEGR